MCFFLSLFVFVHFAMISPVREKERDDFSRASDWGLLTIKTIAIAISKIERKATKLMYRNEWIPWPYELFSKFNFLHFCGWFFFVLISMHLIWEMPLKQFKWILCRHVDECIRSQCILFYSLSHFSSSLQCYYFFAFCSPCVFTWQLCFSSFF